MKGDYQTIGLCKSKILLLIFFLGTLQLFVPLETEAQNNRLINTHSWQYEYIKQLQQRGHLLKLNPTDLPYAEKDIKEALSKIDKHTLDPKEQRWYKLLVTRFQNRPLNIDSMRVGGYFSANARQSSSGRLNVINPGSQGKPVLPRGELRGYLEWQNWISQAGVTHDWFYDVDPVGLDQARRLYIRSEEAYLGYNSDRIDLYIGRFDNHWSVFENRGAFLTDNPRSFDQIQFTFGSSKLSFSSIVGELDNVGPYGNFTGHSYELGSYRRYLFLHRLDWSPLSNLKLSFTEGEIYYSETASIQMRNLLPLHFLFFESHNAPMNNNSNMMLGGSIWYQTAGWTFFLQGMLDDIVVGGGSIPPVYTINSSVTKADVANSFDLGLEADFVSSNAYRSNRYQDQWTYAQRGLATNFSDYIRTKAYATFYPNWLEGLKVEPAVTLYYKGTEDLRDLRTSTEPDGSQIPGILAGTVERTIRPSLYLRYQPMGLNLFGEDNDVRFNFWLDADMGYNITDNYQHIKGATNSRFIGLFRIFGQFTF